MVKIILKEHTLLVLYLAVLFLISIGLLNDSGTNYIFPFFIYCFFFVFSYFVFKWLYNQNSSSFSKFNYSFIFNNFLSEEKLKYIAILLFLITVSFIAIHLVIIGHIPFITALKSYDYYGISLIRQSISDHENVFIKYISSFSVKALIPFLLLFFYLKNKKMFLILFVISIFYCISLMQKSLVVSILIPLIIFNIFQFQFKMSLLFSFISVLSVFFLVFVTNPSLRASKEEIQQETTIENHKNHIPEEIFERSTNSLSGSDKSIIDSIISAIRGIYTRVIVVPGKVVSMWFKYVPDKFPYSQGCGYRFLAPFLGCEFENYNYSRFIYDFENPMDVKEGMKGTANVASFMNDYSNFGVLGLILAGIILAIFFNMVEILFENNFKWLITLNLLFIVWLSSSAFFTTLFSGGWGLTLVLFFLFKRALSSSTVKAH
ncbi:MAG: oligosaccharide repeat unit polymerase [Bacteroidota bacterium]|nr:oligosaccharide repeat unit polymerase [Bacteroidota bacterium]